MDLLSIGLILFFLAIILIQAFIIKQLVLTVQGMRAVKSILLTINGVPRTGSDMPLQLQDTGSQAYGLSEKDGAGNAVTTAADAPPVWSVSDATLATVVAAADGMSATVSAVGPLGTCMIQCSGTWAGTALSGSDTITIIPSPVASISIAPVVGP